MPNKRFYQHIRGCDIPEHVVSVRLDKQTVRLEEKSPS